MGGLDWVLRPIHRKVWADPHRRAQKLFRFAETEADGGRDIARASELTRDGLLRRLYLRHAIDELRHAAMFRERGSALLRSLPPETRTRNFFKGAFEGNWFTPGERGLDDLKVEAEKDDSLLAFLHLSERAAARRFAAYHDVLSIDPETRDVFRRILKDEAFHMNYTYTQLRRVSPQRHGFRLWVARASRLWKGYLRISVAVAGVMGWFMLLVQYFFILGPFSLLAKRAAKKESEGWSTAKPASASTLSSQYR